MIDVHSHVIPKIDDGSNSIEETNEMLIEAREAGFTDIITTSHYIEGYYEVDSIKSHALVKAINKTLQEKNIDLNLYCGNEIFITQNLIQLIKDKKASTLADSKYVLFELPMNNIIKNLNEMIFQIKSIGMIPVIAHPERYSYVQRNPNMLIPLIKQGALLQANYTSILGKYGHHAKITIKKLLKSNMIHFLGSDCHKKDDIYKKIKESIIELEKVIGKEKLKELTTINPSYILKNENLEIEEPIKVKTGLFHLR